MAIPILIIQATTVIAAAPHIIIVHGSLLQQPIVMADWQENHIVIGSLSKERVVKDEELAGREYLDVSLFWGPKWLDYKIQGGSFDALTDEQANQKARLYLAQGDAPPILVIDGKVPRYVGPDGIRILTQHRIPIRLDGQASQAKADSHGSVWLVAALTSFLLFIAALMYLARMSNSGRKENQPAVIEHIAEQR